MSISGLVVVLEADASPIHAEAVARAPGVTVGATPAPGRLPVVLEAPSVHEARRRLAHIERLPGVAQVEVVYVDFGAPDPSADAAVNGDPSA